MQQIKVETEDWKLDAFIDWVPKQHLEKCEHCSGRGTIGGGFKSLDSEETCPKCYGTGQVSKGPRVPRPELPKALVEHMRRAWWDFFNKG